MTLLFISWADFGWMALGLFLMFNALALVTLSLTWLERKALGRLQRRLGPTRTGPMGMMQPVADAIKLIIKEDIIPTSSEKAIFWAAPIIVMLSAFMIWVTIPGAQDAVIKHLDLGLFYIIAFSVVGILGLVLAGWGSANKYGTLGGLRAAAQLISYEIPIIMVAVAVAMLAQSLSLREIVEQQSGYWFFLVQPLGLVIFFIAGLAEVGRTALRHLLRRVGNCGRALCGIQRRPLVVILLGGIHQYLRHSLLDGDTLLRRLAGAWTVGLLVRNLVPVQSLLGAIGDILDTRHLPAAAH